ncbi:helix-hairpin-helix domain-containing protein [Alkalicoccus daliensis]|uniref:Competence protein ComEA n=1 Tax=Alkalicoccus daliensis TaxID=745820 RepID=A0A1H0BF28_9BACI|nr:helix-hairpin-helix domain-containing protein [Alkalicoccus daliensis]SDN44264.1 competence protein ComEA [Alkalicoccus daliensis]
MNAVLDRLKNMDRLLLGKIAGGIILLAAIGLYYFFTEEEQLNSETIMDIGHTAEENDLEETPVEMKVDIKGEVQFPGVYTASSEDRVEKLIDEAGGLTADAAIETVNFAQRVYDEMVIIIPSAEEAEAHTGETPQHETVEMNKIPINTAEQASWETLNGIGPAKASAIIQYREENGPFTSVEELMEVPGIGEKTLESIRDQLSLH